MILQGSLFAQDITKKSDAKMEFQEENYNFGDVSGDSVLTHVFKFNNSGTDTLFIEGVKGSWGCTASLLSSEVIPPGESGELKVTLYTENREGLMRKTIYIASNADDSQVKRLVLSANITKTTATTDKRY